MKQIQNCFFPPQNYLTHTQIRKILLHRDFLNSIVRISQVHIFTDHNLRPINSLLISLKLIKKLRIPYKISEKCFAVKSFLPKVLFMGEIRPVQTNIVHYYKTQY